ncbi:MAG: sporulation integral membrane protein YtvI, partial [Clostridia bacterium]|nr:sporulation integral membrane protein YtvI [Clostridia bacterium]
MKYDTFERRVVGAASILICLIFGAVVLYFFIRYGLAVLLPFLIGWLLASLIVPLAKKISGGSKKKSKAASVIILLLFLILTALLLILAFDRLISEIRRLMDRLFVDSAHVGEMVGQALDFAQSLSEHIPFLGGDELDGIRERIDAFASDIISGVTEKLSSNIPVLLGKLIGAFPSFILFVLVTLISSFYFCTDLDLIYSGIRAVLPYSVSQKLAVAKKRFFDATLKYLRAYCLILLLTFGELFVGLSLLKIDYALLLAALIAIIDILPVLGAGSVLIPWAAVLIFSGNYYMGIGLLIVYTCIAVVRQISEPKIVGGSLGLHPLLTLFAIYAGFKLFGFLGMILGPAFAVVL